MDEIDQALDEQMAEHRKGIYLRLRGILHPDYIEDFAEVLAWACLESCEDKCAKNIAFRLGFGDSEFNAILGRGNDYYEALMAEGAEAYHND